MRFEQEPQSGEQIPQTSEGQQPTREVARRIPEAPRNDEQSPALEGVRQQLQKVARKASDAARELAIDHAEHVHGRYSGKPGHVDVQKGKVVSYVLTTIAESLPGPFLLWGIGDVITAGEAVAGRTMDGIKLSKAERGIYLLASAIPWVPARPFISVMRFVQDRIHSAMSSYEQQKKPQNSTQSPSAEVVPSQNRIVDSK